MNGVEKAFAGLTFLAVVVAIVAGKNSVAVSQSVFGGTSQLFGTILSPVGASAVNPSGT